MRTVVVLAVASSISLLLVVFYISSFTASAFASSSITSARQNNGIAALDKMSIAIKLSPMVSTYPRLRSEFLLALITADPTTRSTYEPIVARDLEKAIKLNPWYHRHYIKAAEAAERLDQREQGIKLYNRALQLVPNSSRLHDRVAASLIDNDQAELAIDYIDNAIRLTQDSDYSYQSYYLAGIAFEDLKQPQNAAAAVLRSLNKAPNSNLCYLAIQYLQQRVKDLENVYDNADACLEYKASQEEEATP